MKYDKYIGIPFKEKGRSFNGSDCWGVVRLFYAYEKNIELPILDSYATTEDADCIQEIVGNQKHNWKKVDEPVFGDVVVVSILKKQTHVGIYLGKGEMLHGYKGTDSCKVSLKSFKWKGRDKEYYRYE